MRLFYGIPLSKGAREALHNELSELGRSATKMKLVEPDNLHITLHFIGETDDVEKYKKALDSVPKGTFDITLSSYGAFPNEDYIKVLWMGVEPEENIINIHRVICRELGLEEQEYTPHITLARLKGKPDGVVTGVLGKRLGTPMKVAKVQLMSSRLTPNGPVYEVVHEVAL